MEGPSAQHATTVIQRLAKPSAAHSQADMWETVVVVEAAKKVLQQGATDLVREANGQPMLSSKSCDGTPMRITHRTGLAFPSGKKVHSSGRRGIDGAGA